MTPNVAAARRVLQFGQTQRYHTEMMLRQQDVAQHSYNVAWLCWLLSDRDPSAALIMAALAHDAGERHTGDIPAPTKRRHPSMHELLDAMENEHTAAAGYTQEPLSRIEAQILKLADMMEGAFYCLRELKMGNRLVMDAVHGGAGINWLAYIESWLSHSDIQAPTVRTAAWELFDYLKEQYGKFSTRPHHHDLRTHRVVEADIGE